MTASGIKTASIQPKAGMSRLKTADPAIPAGVNPPPKKRTPIRSPTAESNDETSDTVSTVKNSPSTISVRES